MCGGDETLESFCFFLRKRPFVCLYIEWYLIALALVFRWLRRSYRLNRFGLLMHLSISLLS